MQNRRSKMWRAEKKNGGTVGTASVLFCTMVGGVLDVYRAYDL